MASCSSAPGRVRYWLMGAAVSLTTLVLLAVAGELLLRIFNPFRLDWRLVTSHPVRRRALAPNFDGLYRDMPVRTNAFGHRIPTQRPKPYGMEKPAGVTRILVFGDSMTFGDEWPAEVSFVEQLQERLDPAAARVQVLNFGVPGYNPFQELDQIRESALKFSPDAVLVVFTEDNDLIPLDASQSRGVVARAKAWMRDWYLYAVARDLWFYRRQSMLARWLRGEAHAAAPASRPAQSDGPPLPDDELRARLLPIERDFYGQRLAEIERDGPGWRQAIASYQAMAGFLGEYGVPFAIVDLPISWDANCQDWGCDRSTLRYDRTIDAGARFHDRLAQEIERVTPHYVSIAEAFAPRTLADLDDGKGHFGPKKNAIVAVEMDRLLQRMGIVATSFAAAPLAAAAPADATTSTVPVAGSAE